MTAFERALAQNECKRRLRERRKAAGVCIYCGQPLAPGCATVCLTHLEQARRRSAQRRQEMRRLGLCVTCGEPSITARCPECRKRANALRRLREQERRAG